MPQSADRDILSILIQIILARWQNIFFSSFSHKQFVPAFRQSCLIGICNCIVVLEENHTTEKNTDVLTKRQIDEKLTGDHNAHLRFQCKWSGYFKRFTLITIWVRGKHACTCISSLATTLMNLFASFELTSVWSTKNRTLC